MPEEEKPFVSFLLNGEELLVSDFDGIWTCCYRGREGQSRYVDHALGQALGRPPESVLGLASRVLMAEPGTELGD